MESKKTLVIALAGLALALFVSAQVWAQSGIVGPPVAPPKSLKQDLGDKIFNDTKLSVPAGISCASCHDPVLFWADPRNTFPTSAGSLGTSGTRNAPQLSYVGFIPKLRFEKGIGYVGGLFWDGSAADLFAQAHGPFLNPIEMNNTPAGVVARVAAAPYAAQFAHVYGPINAVTPKATRIEFDHVADALESYMTQVEFHNFTSKFDAFTKGLTTLTPAESRGLALFNGKATCSQCHPTTASADTGFILFTKFTYHNLGLPVNAAAPPATPDMGLGGVVKSPKADGKFKCPTLRNIEWTFPYGHNGNFATLQSFIRFMNNRAGVKPEVAANVTNPTLVAGKVGNLGLTASEMADLRAFLYCLTDGFIPL